MATREIVFQSEHLVVVCLEYGTDTVFVTFNEMGTTAAGDSFWGDTLFARAGVTAIGFVSTTPNWYPAVDALQAIDAVNKRISGRRVVTYGFSQGGYGALKYAARLNASTALAFSPQWSINPDDVQEFDGRFISHYNPLLRNGERIEQHDLCGANFIFVDPSYEADHANAKHLLALDDITAIPARFALHGTVRLISEGRTGRRLIELASQVGGLSTAALRQVIRSSRRQSSMYLTECATFLSQTASRHGRLFKAAIERLPESPSREMILVRYHLTLGDKVSATATLEAIPQSDLATVSLNAIWGIFRSAGFDYGEGRIAPLFRTLYPTDVFARLHGVNSFAKLGRHDEAVSELETLRSMPGAHNNLPYFMQFYLAVNRPDLLSAFVQEVTSAKQSSRKELVHIGFYLAEAYRDRNLRGSMFAELLQLRRLCMNDIPNVIRLADLLLSIGERSAVHDYLADQSSAVSEAPMVQLYAIWLAPADTSDAREAAVKVLLNSDETSYQYWIRFSIFAEEVHDFKTASRASTIAIKRAGNDEESVEARRRLANVFASSGHRRKALKEVKKLSNSPHGTGHLAQSLADIAFRCGRDDLGVTIAQRWFAANPKIGHVNLMYCHYLLSAGAQQEAARMLDALFAQLPHTIRLDRGQYKALIDNGRRVDYIHESRAVSLAREAFPDDIEFRNIKLDDAFAAKFYVANASTSTRRQGILTRLNPFRSARASR